MTKRKISNLREHSIVKKLIERGDVEEFGLFFSEFGAGADYDIFDLSAVSAYYQKPFIFHACLHSSKIAHFLIKHMDADVRVIFQGRTVLGAAVRPLNYEIDLDLVKLILEKMAGFKLKVPERVITYIDARRLLEVDSQVLLEVSQIFDQHNQNIDAVSSPAAYSSAAAASDPKRQKRESGDSSSLFDLPYCSEAASVPIIPTFSRRTSDLKFQADDLKQLLIELQTTLQTALVAIETNPTQLLDIVNQVITQFNVVQNSIGKHFSLPTIYRRYPEYFPTHFLQTQVELLRTYERCNISNRDDLDLPSDLFYRFAWIIGAKASETPNPGYRCKLKLS